MAIDKGYGKCTYDDTTVKYPLQLDKSKIPYKNQYVVDGGVQLMEMMEREFSYEWILQNQKQLKLNNRQIETLGWWIKHNWNLAPTVNEFKLWLGREKAAGRNGERNESTISSHVKSLFVGYKGLFAKLLKLADVKPRIDKNGNITFLYSFLSESTTFQNGNYKIVSIEFKEKKFEDVFNKLHNNLYIYEWIKNEWRYVNEEEEIYQDIKDMIEITNKIASI